MNRLRPRKKLVAASAVLALVGGAGAAIAASDAGPSPSSFLDSVAEHLGISREELDEATRAAALDQVDAALEAGRITEEEAERLRKEIESGELPPFFGLPLFGPHLDGPRGADGERGFDFRFEFGFGLGPGDAAGVSLSDATEYLGLSVEQLRERVADGETLAEIAEAEGKSVDGLVDALLADAKKRLDDAVADDRLSRERADEVLERLETVVRDFVENGFRGLPRLHVPRPFFPEPGAESTGSL
jgi:hypothetical protein